MKINKKTEEIIIYIIGIMFIAGVTVAITGGKPVINKTEFIPANILKILQPYIIPTNRVSSAMVTSEDGSGPVYVYELPGTNPKIFVFSNVSGAIDCDGQTTTECNSQTDPWYQNETSCQQADGKPLIASSLPYYVLPNAGSKYWDYTKNNIVCGQLGAIIYDNGISKVINYGVFGDENAPGDELGEISYAMAKSLKINPDPQYGGVSSGMTFIIFSGSENIISPIENHSNAVDIGNKAMNKLMEQLQYLHYI